MKRWLTFYLALVLGTAPLDAQKAIDAVIVDPQAHGVVLENDHVRVIEARAPQSARSAMHSHPPLVFIGMDTARVKFGLPGGTSTIFDINPGQMLWLADGMERSWELMSGKVSVIGVEVNSAQKVAAGGI